MVKRLFFDIETSPNIGLFWEAGYKKNISHDSIIKERAIICICYKWGNNKTTYSLTWDSKQNDKKMLAEFIQIANTADEIVGHNGDKFDMAWVRTRCVFHGLECFPAYKTTDTLKVARSKFKFNSNKLDYIASFLGLGNKLSTGYGLWKAIVLDKCDKSLKAMVKYCKKDVILLEDVYNKLKNHINPISSVSERNNECNECGSLQLVVNKTRLTAQGYKRYQLQCKCCGKMKTVNKL